MQFSTLSEILFVVGGILLVIGLVIYWFPPAHIMPKGSSPQGVAKSRKAWKDAQRLSARCLLILAGFFTLAGAAFLFINLSSWPFWLLLLVAIGILVTGFTLAYISVEKALKRKLRK